MPMPVFVDEKKAREKTCPLSLQIAPVYAPDGSGIRDGGPFGCLGAECMAWRFARTHINNPEGGDMIESFDTYGYCGLAGVPGQLR
jgi:hypothetical protein